MKITTKNPATVLSGWTRFLGAMLTLALMVPAAAVSQLSAVNLGTAGNFVILAEAGITATAGTHITGDIGISPATAAAITGFGLALDGTGTFSTSSLVTGKVYAANYTEPTQTKMTAAVGDMENAYTNAAGRTPIPTGLFLDRGAGEIGGLTLVPGLYKWTTAVTISTNVTLDGSSTDVWIFQIAGTLNISPAKQVILSGGAQAANIFWQVAGQVTLGTTAAMKGIILGQTGIAIQTGATLNGRALAQTAVTLDANTVTGPTTVNAVENGLAPEEFTLSQNYPNPFNPSTRIQYSLEKAAQVSLKVYNVLGIEVATLVNGRQEAGSYTVQFGANKATSALPSGVYFCRLEAGSFVSTKKLTLMK